MSEHRPRSSETERRADKLAILLSAGAAAVAAPAVVVIAIRLGVDGATLAATGVYAVTLLGMFLASAAYHLVENPDLANRFRRVDRAAIYLKIAGTYTPFAVMLGGGRTLAILAGMWSAALIGVALAALAPRRLESLGLVLYVAMGWAIAVVGWPIIAAMQTGTLALFAAGAVLYSLGVGVFVWRGLGLRNAIWHGLVLLASALIYGAILVELRAAAAA
jgi:hemolysin III